MSELTLQELTARTARMKAEGTLPVLTGPPVQLERGGGVRVCLHLGESVSGGCTALYKCAKKGGLTTLFVRCPDAQHHCETCGADTRKAAPARSKPLTGGSAPGGSGAVAPVGGLTPVGRRHLACHILPVAGNGVWRRAVDQLRLRWDLFDGRKVVAVATGAAVTEQVDPHETDPTPARRLALESADAVRAYLPPDAEVVAVDNREHLWESASWPELFGRVFAHAGPADAVLYAHAKGVTRRLTSPVHQWADMLWRLSLDYWPQIESLLRAHPLAGSLTRVGTFFGAPNERSAWHYSGNFWWARVPLLRAAMARTPVPADRWAAEAWPGMAFPAAAAGTLFTADRDFYLYDPAALSRVAADFCAFSSAQKPSPPHALKAAAEARPPGAKRKEGPPRLSVIVPTTGRATLARTLDSIRAQLEPGDEVITIADRTGDWGATPRTEGMRKATGDYLMFMDDDDLYLPGAFAAVRAALAAAPGRPHLFGMRRGAPFHDVLPLREDVAIGNVSTQMIVAPNDPARLGTWGTRYEGDYDFISSTLALYPPDAVVWRPEVIAVWRPGG